MSRATAWAVHLAAIAVGVTGVVYGWMRYALEPVDEFSLVHHPAEPVWKSAHILLAPLLVFAVGVIWLDHVWPRVRAGARARRATGLVLFALLAPMVVSGYGLQVSEAETWRTAWTWLHAVTGGVWFAVYGVHQLSSRDG